MRGCCRDVNKSPKGNIREDGFIRGKEINVCVCACARARVCVCVCENLSENLKGNTMTYGDKIT
jgi:hypothetical protein